MLNVSACLPPAHFLLDVLSEQVFFHTGKISEVYDQYSLTQPNSPPGLVAAGLNCSAHMLMISLLNGAKSTAKCIQLCMYMPRPTNSLLTITRKGGCVRVYSSFRPKSGEKCWLIFSLHQFGCANTHR